MNLQLDSVYSNFRLLEIHPVAEIKSVAYLFRHEPTGARLLYLANDEENKVFSISFRTPPTDHTGLPHILEHSVLCGSRKFPLREPFVELVKGSLNTFLNAMTFPDKTMYPVASQNDKDFRNLMDVYLDAVFFPRIHATPEILMQEGWHYDIEDPSAPLTYKGVVYNEMKGVFSNPESLLERKTQEILFPDTPYYFESGGDPDHIPALTQEQFTAFHRRYYHPANSFLYLYGKMDILDQLAFLEGEYLQQFQALEIDSTIALQQPFHEIPVKIFDYSVAAQEKTEGKTFLSMNYVVGQADDAELALAFGILTHILLGTQAAPLRKALIAAGIGKDVYGSFENGLLQPVFSAVARNAEADQIEKFQVVIRETLERLVAEGLDKQLVEASINAKEFQLREANYGSWPKGLVYNIKCMNSWLYDSHPTLHLEYETALANIRRALEEPYFEQLIQRYLLENTHGAVIAVQPKAGLEEEHARMERERLANIKAGMEPAQLAELVRAAAMLKELQTAEDSEEALASIPLLSLADIEATAPELPCLEREIGGNKVLAHPLFTNRILYLDLYFDTSCVPQEDLPYLYMLSALLGKVGAGKYSYSDLALAVNLHTGGITYNTGAYDLRYDDKQFSPRFLVKAKCLNHKIPELFGLIGDILCDSQFADKARLREIVAEIRARVEGSIQEQGHLVAMQRLLSYFSPVGAYTEIGGLSFYRFITALEAEFETRWEAVAAKLFGLAKEVCGRKNLLISITGSEEEYQATEQPVRQLLARLPEGSAGNCRFSLPQGACNEGLMTSGKVQYVAQGYNFRRLGFTYSGAMRVLESILRYDYLWNRIRVQGGAYGAFSQFERNGNVSFVSYRDPNLKETLDVYRDMAAFLREFSVTDREMTKYIIGTMSKVDMPLTPQMKGERASSRYIQGLTQADIQRERDELLTTRQEDIRKFAAIAAAVYDAGYICVLGNGEKIRQEEVLFSKLVPVFE